MVDLHLTNRVQHESLSVQNHVMLQSAFVPANRLPFVRHEDA